MIDTAQNAAALKKANGGRARNVEKPVYHYSLSFPYQQGQPAPSHEEMISAARDSLKAIGLQDHQAVMIIHNDEKHPHIHIMAKGAKVVTVSAIPALAEKVGVMILAVKSN